MFKRVTVLLIAVIAAVSVTACSSTATDTEPHNAADVSFAQLMIPHHRQAVEMAKLAGTRAEDPRIKALAAKIQKAQDPEIATMTGWLKDWNAKVPAGMDMGGTTMPGMMSEQQMTALASKSGQGFDAIFVQMMIEHHSGAVAMAEQQLKNGQYGPAKDLARQIIKTQNAEIVQMQSLYKHG